MNLKRGIAVGLCCATTVASAQEVVTLGTFGFVKDAASSAGYHISGMQFYADTNNTPDTLYSTNLPLNSMIYAWNGAGYDPATYKKVYVSGQGFVTKWSDAPELPNGQGYWVDVPSAAEAVLSGTVPMDDAITNSIAAGFQICSFPYPVSCSITNLGFTPSEGDMIYVWDGDSYDPSTYKKVYVSGQGFVTKWSNDAIELSPGEGFWYDSVANTNWIALRPYPAE